MGSGAGHWIDFYLDLFDGSAVMGLELSERCVRTLHERYATCDEVSILEADIADDTFAIERRFDIVNAIGVMFHIVDDARWLQALRNIRDALKREGVVIVGGYFGLVSRNVEFDEDHEGDGVVVNKRLRSLAAWRRGAAAAGLHVKQVLRTESSADIVTPENHVLVLERAT